MRGNVIGENVMRENESGKPQPKNGNEAKWFAAVIIWWISHCRDGVLLTQEAQLSR